jgi:hypothetical protein
MDNYAIGFPKFAKILSWIELRPDGVSLSSRRSHFSCMQFPYQGLARLDRDICHPDGESDPYTKLACPDHEDRHLDVWILNARLAL